MLDVSVCAFALERSRCKRFRIRSEFLGITGELYVTSNFDLILLIGRRSEKKYLRRTIMELLRLIEMRCLIVFIISISGKSSFLLFHVAK